MCNRKDCIYCEIIELPSGSKLFIHYNTLFTPLWIEFNNDATDINEKYFPEDKREVLDDFITDECGIRLSRNWEAILNKKLFQIDCAGNIVDIEYEELS